MELNDKQRVDRAWRKAMHDNLIMVTVPSAVRPAKHASAL
eukprot:SAG31_NODE_1466_length_8227_cov_10.254675_6_plen_40_part_00